MNPEYCRDSGEPGNRVRVPDPARANGKICFKDRGVLHSSKPISLLETLFPGEHPPLKNLNQRLPGIFQSGSNSKIKINIRLKIWNRDPIDPVTAFKRERVRNEKF